MFIEGRGRREGAEEGEREQRRVGRKGGWRGKLYDGGRGRSIPRPQRRIGRGEDIGRRRVGREDGRGWCTPPLYYGHHRHRPVHVCSWWLGCVYACGLHPYIGSTHCQV